ncbi:hypothetical protein glysoja_022572 [Glycine soja]|nr:hypothetical protein glysoja_022572 [Glycine soja]
MGSWVNEPQLYYKGGEVHVIHGLDANKWSYFEAMRLLTELGDKGDGDLEVWWKGKGTDFHSLKDLVLDQDAMDLTNYVLTHNYDGVQTGIGEQSHDGNQYGNLEQCGNVQESGNLDQLGNVKQSDNVNQSASGENLEQSGHHEVHNINFIDIEEERDLGMDLVFLRMESSYYSDELDSDNGQDGDIESYARKHVTFKKEEMHNFIKQSVLLSEYYLKHVSFGFTSTAEESYL